jgi:hypothetical protein
MKTSPARFVNLLMAVVLSAGVIFVTARADEVRFLLDNNAWAGNPNLSIYAPSSGAAIDYEIYVEIGDVDFDGPDTQGLVGFSGDLLSNTGLMLPTLAFSPTNLDLPATIDDPLWSGPGTWVGGFGLGFVTSLGTPIGDDRIGIGAFGGVTPPIGSFPELLTNIGFGAPNDPGRTDSGGNPFPYYGTARDKWYLMRGQVSVPDMPGTYTVEYVPPPNITNMIRLNIDLNDDLTEGWIESATLTGTVVGDSFSFTVMPEPAAVAVLLAFGAFVARRRA